MTSTSYRTLGFSSFENISLSSFSSCLLSALGRRLLGPLPGVEGVYNAASGAVMHLYRSVFDDAGVGNRPAVGYLLEALFDVVLAK